MAGVAKNNASPLGWRRTDPVRHRLKFVATSWNGASPKRFPRKRDSRKLPFQGRIPRMRLRGSSYCYWPLLAFNVHCVVGGRLRGNLLPPMRRLGRNGDDVAFAEVVGLASFNGCRHHLIGAGSLRADHGPASHESGLPLDHDKDVVGMFVVFHLTSFPAIGEHDQARVVHDGSAFGHHGGDFVVADVVNSRRDATPYRGRGGGQENSHGQQCSQHHQGLHLSCPPFKWNSHSVPFPLSRGSYASAVLSTTLLSTPRSNHLPSFFEPFIYVGLGERCYAASHVVSLACCQNRLTGLFDFGRILRHAKILVQITPGTDEDGADARHGGNLVDVL